MKAKSGISRDLLIGFREMVVESIRIIFLDPKEDHRFSCYNTAILDTTLNHIRICLSYSRRHQSIRIIAKLLLWIGRNRCSMYDFGRVARRVAQELTCVGMYDAHESSARDLGVVQ